MKLVKDYMKKKVITIKPSDSIFRAAHILSKHHISGAPVVKNKRVLGVITEADMIKFMKLDLSKTHTELMTEPHAISVVILALIKDQLGVKERLERLSEVKVKDFMAKNVISIDPDENILEAASLLDKNQIDRLPVIKKERLVGIISRCDLIKALIY